MTYTIDDVSTHTGVNGERVPLSDAERQAIADEWNANEIEQAEEQATEAAEQLRLQNLRGDALAVEMLAQLRTATPTQISTFVDNNVTDLPSARTMFKRVLLVMALIADRPGA